VGQNFVDQTFIVSTGIFFVLHIVHDDSFTGYATVEINPSEGCTIFCV